MYGTTIVSCAAPLVTPGVAGIPNVARPDPESGEQRIRMAVVAARELEDPVAPCGGASEPDRAHRRLGAGGDEAHQLQRRNRVDQLLGELDLALGRRAESRALARGRDHRIDRLRVGVAEDQRSHDITQST